MMNALQTRKHTLTSIMETALYLLVRMNSRIELL
jgi:hypothetical protein